MHLPPIPRFFVRWFFRLVFALIFVGLPCTLVYLRKVGVTGPLKSELARKLSGAQFHTTIGRLTFDPFRGLVAQQVEVVESGPEGRALARVERLVVSVSLSDLVAGKVTVEVLELDGSNVSVPVGRGADERRLDLRNVSAHAILLDDQLRISSFEASVQGMRVYIRGLLQHPGELRFGGGSNAQNFNQGHDTVSDVLKSLSQVVFVSNPPTLRAEIHGDLADPSSIRIAPITLTSGPIAGEKWRIDGLDASAEYADGALLIGRFAIRGPKGEFETSGRYASQVLTFEMSSSLDPKPFLGLLPKDSPFTTLDLASVPQIDATGSMDFSGGGVKPDVIGSVRLGNFGLRGAKFDSLAMDFAWKDGRFYARNTKVRADGGTLDASVLVGPGDFRLRFQDTIRPTALAPLLGEKERAFLGLMEFKDPPFISMNVAGTGADLGSVKGSGQMRLGRTALRGAWIDSAVATVEIADKAVTYRDFTITQGKGARGTGTFVYDVGRQEVRLNGVDSTLNPVDILMWADPKIAETVRAYRFRSPPHVLANGMAHLKDVHLNNLNLELNAADGLDYDLLGKTLKFGRTLAAIKIDGANVRANVSSAQLMGGDIGLRAIVSIDAADPTFSADVDVRRVDFEKLSRLYFGYKDSKGVVSGNYKFKARMGQETRMQGAGSLRVEDGNVFAIPILGPLSEILNLILPGVGYQTAREATADFTIADEKINTRNLAIEGAGFSLYGHGDIYFVRDKLDMSVRINARGIPGIVLFPVSKLFEYVSTGTVADPGWRPKIIPRFGGGREQ